MEWEMRKLCMVLIYSLYLDWESGTHSIVSFKRIEIFEDISESQREKIYEDNSCGI
jgi:hypothetical protein